ncbi:MAG: 50S ribosomal protein L29 [Parcubacteria group bacterium GW2011_GWB1_41_6]|nr:MAG: 50S ribosomal protein L29 [Parcubacteria group bacterium GW2011_GWB1_41_6]KKS58041.1 MAG: 50S ribosomal protein L29 [Parcubacteria group bacterium GW2011_GWA2_42_35]
MKAKEIGAKTKKELEEFLREKREALRRFRFNFVSGKMKNTKEARELRKDIARIFTILNPPAGGKKNG